MSESDPPRPSKLKRVGIAVGVLGLLWALNIVLIVDDWGRDFTTNTAQTAEDAENLSLRPITSDRSLDELAKLVGEVAVQRLGWSVGETQSTSAQRRLTFVRTTRVFRFKDDIEVLISEAAGARKITARSASRVGKGDLGQNPRNLVELLDALRDALPK